jgi:hypothetical protein
LIADLTLQYGFWLMVYNFNHARELVVLHEEQCITKEKRGDRRGEGKDIRLHTDDTSQAAIDLLYFIQAQPLRQSRGLVLSLHLLKLLTFEAQNLFQHKCQTLLHIF